jgi:hypothetical protein
VKNNKPKTKDETSVKVDPNDMKRKPYGNPPAIAMSVHLQKKK